MSKLETESAGLGVGAAIILGNIPGKLNMKTILKALNETAMVTGLMGLILIGAGILNQAVSLLGLPRQLVIFVDQNDLHPTLILVDIFFIFLIVGCFFDAISMLVMTLPFPFPVITALGHDPV